MQEIAITIRFNRVCLGAAKKRKNGQVVFCFDRDPVDRVMFLSSAWLSCLRYAAKLANRHHAAVKKIDWCPVITGTPKKDWRRTILTPSGSGMRSHYAVHEAFPPGEQITLTAVLPDEISIEDFVQLLTIVGKYKGFSPFNNSQDKYGTYEVISVEPVSSPGNE